MNTLQKFPAAEHDPHAHCRAVASVLDRIGDKWTVMVVGLLSKGTLRFNQIQRTIGGISHRMLTLTLRGLERDGLVVRTIYPTVPPKVEYSLTEAGKTLIPALSSLSAWAAEHQQTVENARRDYDARNGS